MARLILSKRIAALAEDISPLRHLSWVLEGGIMLLFWGLCAVLPVAIASRFGGALVGAAGPRLHKHRHMIANLTVALRGRTPAEVEQIARAAWRNFGMVLAEYPHLRRIARDRLEYDVAPGARAVFAAEQRAIFVTAHLANWELGAAGIVHCGGRIAAIYSPQSNPAADWAMFRFRSAIGGEYLPKENAMRAWLREGQRGRSLGLVVDQRVDGGALLPFFGVAGETITTPARLATRLNCPLLPFRVLRIGVARYRVCFEAPVTAAEAQDVATTDTSVNAELALTNALLRRVEGWISERPGEWLCTKRRWPKQRDTQAAPA